eukprot:CAMPEP_0182808592 /NCGR_PEP_ID=MMETSP0006_2-20121128/6731_1 /TAXON_ID=97485 /ORGANISM="Prymnesium parvum, Strain Texoma1" /LENGTH=290 /DNA_ID=CAMNT_0024934317 /DNA_START=519 /DNA_END=1386 /DNA_ORIENTATION=+
MVIEGSSGTLPKKGTPNLRAISSAAARRAGEDVCCRDELQHLWALRAEHLYGRARHVGAGGVAEAKCVEWRSVLRHVLDHAEDAKLRLGAEGELFAYIDQAHLLWSRHDERAVVRAEGFRQVLHERDVFVRGAWRRVDDEVVERAPLHVGEELLDQPVLTRAAPDHRVVVVGQHEADRHHAQLHLVLLVVAQPLARHVDGRPAGAALVHRLPLQPEHQGNARPTDVDIEQPHPEPPGCKRERQLRGESAFAHSAFSRENENFPLHVLQPRADELELRILLPAGTLGARLL